MIANNVAADAGYTSQEDGDGWEPDDPDTGAAVAPLVDSGELVAPEVDAGTDAALVDVDAALADAGTDADTDAGTDAETPCGGDDVDENQIPDDCEECPIGGCLPVIWSLTSASSPYDLVGSQTSIELLHPTGGASIAIEVGPVSPPDDVRRSHLITSGDLLQAINTTYTPGDALADVRGHLRGLRQPPMDDHVSVVDQTRALPGGVSYVKVTQQTNDWRFLIRWTFHGAP